MMRMENRMKMRTEMRQFFLPQMQQSLHMLQMNSFELDQFLEECMETNPFLERVDSRETALSEIELVPETEETPVEENVEQRFEQNILGRTEQQGVVEGWDRTERYREGVDFARNEDEERTWRYYQDSITQEESLSAHLLNQMRLAAATSQEYKIGERIIIGDIDHRGYFTGSIEEIAKELGASEDEVKAVLSIIKKFEPVGVGASDIVECLLMQAEVEYPDNTELKTLLTCYWKDLTHGRFAQIAEAMNSSVEKVMELKELISHLDPFPGREYGGRQPIYIVPEVIVEEVDGDFIAVLATDSIPQVTINESYIEEIRRQKTTKEDEKYVREQLDSARWIKRNLERRQETILKTAQAIVDLQRPFMKHGLAHMKPLTLEEVARKIGVHESTVSRAINGKYIQTPQGLFEMKYFFQPGLRSESGVAQSATAVCEQIKAIIDAEDKRRPLSDQKIADILNARGIHVARRTVAKYREQSGILPVKMRREY